MSMLKHYQTLAAMAMLAAGGAGDAFNMGQGYPSRPKSAPRKCDQKKCKSCKEFYPLTYKGTCPYKRYVDPLACACENYKPKRKK